MAEYVSADWLADYLQLKSPRAVHELARAGKFRAYRLGRRTVRFRLDEVKAALEASA
jgi:excisionase family DNA binding protein